MVSNLLRGVSWNRIFKGLVYPRLQSAVVAIHFQTWNLCPLGSPALFHNSACFDLLSSLLPCVRNSGSLVLRRLINPASLPPSTFHSFCYAMPEPLEAFDLLELSLTVLLGSLSCPKASSSLGFCPFIFSGLFSLLSGCFFSVFFVGFLPFRIPWMLELALILFSLLSSFSSLWDFPHSNGSSYYFCVGES